MSRTQRLRLGEIRAVFDLVGRLTAVGHDPDAWRDQAINGLRDLLHAEVGFTADLLCGRAGAPPRLVRPLDFGWTTDRARQLFYEYLASGQAGEDPGTIELLRLHERTRFVTRTRRQMVDDERWYRAPAVAEARRGGDVDDFLSSTFAIRPGVLQGFILYRGWGAKPFDAHDQRLLRFFHVQILRHLAGKKHPKEPADGQPPLSPRLRQTLDLLLAGHGTKEIAQRLRLSPHTVNDYQKALHKRFDVTSRGELLSRCHRLHAVTGLVLPDELAYENAAVV